MNVLRSYKKDDEDCKLQFDNCLMKNITQLAYLILLLYLTHVFFVYNHLVYIAGSNPFVHLEKSAVLQEVK